VEVGTVNVASAERRRLLLARASGVLLLKGAIAELYIHNLIIWAGKECKEILAEKI